MKQRKEFEKQPSAPAKKGSQKTVQELTEQIAHIIGKNPKKAVVALEAWVKDGPKTHKKAS